MLEVIAWVIAAALADKADKDLSPALFVVLFAVAGWGLYLLIKGVFLWAWA